MPIRIPPQDFQEFTEKPVTLIGFGKRPPLRDTPMLQEVTGSICDAKCCKAKFEPTQEYHMCFVPNHTPAGICFGDGGSPMLMDDGHSFPLQIGMAVFVFQNISTIEQYSVTKETVCQGAKPVSGYLRIAAYIHQIEQITGLRRDKDGYLV